MTVVQTIALTFTGIDQESFDRWILSLSGLPVRPGAVAYRPVHVGVAMTEQFDGSQRAD